MENNIEPSIIPKKRLYTGIDIPCIGMGTFGSDRFTPEQVSKAVAGAIRCGYRMFDCAAIYGNEYLIGEVFQEAIDKKVVEREELFIMTKVWNDMHRRVEESCLKSIEDLRCDYIDVFFIHWPFPNYHAPGCSGDSRNPESKPFSVEEFVHTYKQVESLVKKGLVKQIGFSNMTIAKIEAVWEQLEIKPAVCEIELHPCFQQPELCDYLREKDMQIIGFMPIGSPARPDRDVMKEDVADIELPEMKKIAANHGIHPAVVALKWAAQRGQIPVPFSANENEYISNLYAMTTDPLTREEMQMIESLEKGNRLARGQVFLWEHAKDWHDLWDEDGNISK